MIKGELSRKFFDYLSEYNIDINDLDVSAMLKICAETGLKYGYVKMLKSRYKTDGKKILLIGDMTVKTVRGKLSKKFFDYLSEHNIDINNLDGYTMSKISLETGLKYSYVRYLKSVYKTSVKKVPLNIKDILWALDKFHNEYHDEDGKEFIVYDIYSKMKYKHKKIMCGYLEKRLGRGVSVSLFNKIRVES